MAKIAGNKKILPHRQRNMAIEKTKPIFFKTCFNISIEASDFPWHIANKSQKTNN